VSVPSLIAAGFPKAVQVVVRALEVEKSQPETSLPFKS